MWLTSWTACTPTIMYTSESLCTYLKWMMLIQEKYKLQIQTSTNQKTWQNYYNIKHFVLKGSGDGMIHFILLLSFWICPFSTVISWAQHSVSETESLMSLSKIVWRHQYHWEHRNGLISVQWHCLCFMDCVGVYSFRPEDRNGTCSWILDNVQCSGTR
jgi:hypothetical protein